MEQNIAFIDGQNLHLGTKSDGRSVDFYKFRIFLKDKFQIKKAYYFMGCFQDKEQDLYKSLQEKGFIVLFREHVPELLGKKKGNVDSDIVFEIMRSLYEDIEVNKTFLISGDGDYIKVIKHLIKKNKLGKILFPNKQFSSLYKSISNQYYYPLSMVKHKISLKKKLL